MAKNMDMVSSRTKIKVSTGYRVFQVCNTILMILVCVITPVSYTHLDVYKRQVVRVEAEGLQSAGIELSFI